MRSAAILIALLVPAAAIADDEDRHYRHSYRGTEFVFSAGAGALLGDTLEAGESPIFENRVDIDDGFYGEARFGVRFNRWFEVEGDVAYTPTSFVSKTGNPGLFGTSGRTKIADLKIWHYTANANFHFLEYSRWDPFFTLGAGAATYDADLAQVDADTKFAFVIGGGFYAWINDTLGLRFDAKDLITVLDVDNDYDYNCGCYYDYDTDSSTLHNVALLGGIALRFH